jgi:hypothetical protein
MGINKLKPQKYSHYKQGYLNPNSCKKYFMDCKQEPIVYRSGLELKFIQFCESTHQIKWWASEPIEIKYVSKLDNAIHTYYPDYVIESQDGQRAIVEIKPYAQTKEPGANATLWEREQWIKNISKWKFAKEFAKDKGWKFMIITEKFFG